jgi:hypothetical protein
VLTAYMREKQCLPQMVALLIPQHFKVDIAHTVHLSEEQINARLAELQAKLKLIEGEVVDNGSQQDNGPLIRH